MSTDPSSPPADDEQQPTNPSAATTGHKTSTTTTTATTTTTWDVDSIPIRVATSLTDDTLVELNVARTILDNDTKSHDSRNRRKKDGKHYLGPEFCLNTPAFRKQTLGPFFAAACQTSKSRIIIKGYDKKRSCIQFCCFRSRPYQASTKKKSPHVKTRKTSTYRPKEWAGRCKFSISAHWDEAAQRWYVKQSGHGCLQHSGHRPDERVAERIQNDDDDEDANGVSQPPSHKKKRKRSQGGGGSSRQSTATATTEADDDDEGPMETEAADDGDNENSVQRNSNNKRKRSSGGGAHRPTTTTREADDDDRPEEQAAAEPRANNNAAAVGDETHPQYQLVCNLLALGHSAADILRPVLEQNLQVATGPRQILRLHAALQQAWHDNLGECQRAAR